MHDPEGSKKTLRGTAVTSPTPTGPSNDAKPPIVPGSTPSGAMVEKLWTLLDRHFNPRENKVQRAVANALIALDEHEFDRNSSHGGAQIPGEGKPRYAAAENEEALRRHIHVNRDQRGGMKKGLEIDLLPDLALTPTESE